MKQLLTLYLLAFTTLCFAQKKPNALKITYEKKYNGKITEENNPIYIFSDASQTVLTSKEIVDNKAGFPYEKSFIDRKTNFHIQTARLSDSNEIATVDSLGISKQQFELLKETKTILGYKCKKAKTIINSNTIEIWYTNDLGIKGAPSILGQDLGLVLEMNRNNNFIITASKIEKIKAIPENVSLLKTELKTSDLLTYRDLLWKSRFTTIKIFENEIINFSHASKSNDSIFRFGNGTIIVKKVKIPKINNGSQIYIDLSEQSNGDAYDRTGSVFLIPMDGKISFLDGLQKGIKELPAYENGNGKSYLGMVRTENYSPLIELMRFFTPFGIKQYNHIQLKDKTWHETVSYRQEISELVSALDNQDVYIGTFIGNYDKGGHKISLNLTIHNEEKQVAKSTLALPIFNSTNVMEMAGQEYATLFNSEKGLKVSFTLDKDLMNAKLRYITTGHGGWENGDEFLPKKNTIILDGKEAFSFVPWRTDCGSYRLYNPASGNFANGLSSSDYSRSNWCPGMATIPNFIDLGDLKAGKHTISVKIPQGEPEGNSFSFWNVSGVLIGE
ncbi:GLPGLI family protein [Flavobacterium macacae]|uniref:GLPGLI family protein n=1 Tax=Flavobacterium macacae TaxID=2488993 RepID=A0A3P3WA08_9FLAO|nr:GLPGLI family protein [Flavobacterium macacae]RRJ90459.1 GLPGLI family protein [Flavobacterium macacae]